MAADASALPAAPAFERKSCPPEAVRQRAALLDAPVVFTNGCFDLLHRGHVTYLAQARALGASLVVALNTDASVRRLGKGEDRPVNTLADRMAVIAALECVDLVKGGDWSVDRIIGASGVIARGGRVVSIPFIHQRSTTALLERIRTL